MATEFRKTLPKNRTAEQKKSQWKAKRRGENTKFTPEKKSLGMNTTVDPGPSGGGGGPSPGNPGIGFGGKGGGQGASPPGGIGGGFGGKPGNGNSFGGPNPDGLQKGKPTMYAKPGGFLAGGPQPIQRGKPTMTKPGQTPLAGGPQPINPIYKGAPSKQSPGDFGNLSPGNPFQMQGGNIQGIMQNLFGGM